MEPSTALSVTQREVTGEVTLKELEKRWMEPRSLVNNLLTILAWVMAVFACVPLFSVLIMLIIRGSARLSWSLFTELPPTAFEMGGGFGNAILGTVVMVGIAMLLSVPFGIMAAIFLAELGPDSKIASIARFCAKTLTGLPSILAGVFAYASVVLAYRHLFGSGRRHCFGAAHDADRDVDRRRGHEDGAPDHERRRPRHGLHPHPGRYQGGHAHGHARDHHRGDPGRGPGRGGNRAAAVYRAVQRILALPGRQTLT